MAGLFPLQVLLGSATLSLESYHNAIINKYGLVKLKQRYGDTALPTIEIIDTRRVKSKNPDEEIISQSLKEAIQNVLEKQRQVILFQNRRDTRLTNAVM